MRKTIVLLTGVCLCACSVFAQMEIEWERNYGGSDDEFANSIEQTNDGGYIIAGYSLSNDQDVGGNNGGWDYWIVRLNSSGDTIWTRNFGGNDNESASSIQQTVDGGYVVAGWTLSNDLDVGENNGIFDYWIVKLNSSGNITWDRNFGGSDSDVAFSIQQTVDGGYVVAGWSGSNDLDVNENNGLGDYWIVKLNSSGDITWDKNFGGSSNDRAYSIRQTADGGYVIAGFSSSDDKDVGGNNGALDYWIVKLNSSGDTIWTRNFGGSDDELATSIQQTNDGGYIIAGYSESDDQDVGGNNGAFDYWIVKLNSSGDTTWTRNYGGSGDDTANSIQQTVDGGYIVAGISWSDDKDVGGNNGSGDYWIVKLDQIGNLIWDQNFGGSNHDGARSIQQTSDGGYIIAGDSESNDQDVGGNKGNRDVWIVKLKPCPTYTTTIDTLLCPGEVAPLPDTLITYFGCDSIINYNIIELPLPGDGQEFTVCALEAQLQAPSLGDTITGVWTSDTPGIIFSDAQAPDAVVEGLQPGRNQFTWTVSHPECPDYSSAELAVFYEDGVIEVEDDIYNYTPDVLQANILDNDLFPNLTDIEAIIVEDFGGSGDAGELELDPSGNFTFSLPEPTVVLSRQFRYRVAHTSCPELFDEATVRINLNSNTGQEGEEESTSLVFTPNGDGINDRFIIPELEERPQDFPANSLVVINRWGDVVYKAQPYNNDWDGTHWRTGEALPQGTYFYIARLSVVEGIVREERVTLIR